MKKILVAVLMWPLLVLAQSYPSPTLQNLTVLGSFTGTIGLPTLAAQAANTVVANVTGSSASPTAFPMPSCSGANNALRWTSGTGFTCASAIALTSGNLSQFAATTSAQLAGVISDETGSGALVFATNPSLGAATFSGNVAINNSNAQMQVNDTSGTGHSDYYFYNNSSPVWSLRGTNTSTFQLVRYVGGTLADTPISVANSTGTMTLADAVVLNGALSGTGLSNYLASPPAIGGTAANSGAFTTLSASGTVSGTGFTNLVAPYAPLASPALTGTPTAPTAAVGTNTTQLATTAFIAKHEACININDYGGDPTGTNDNSTALNNAIAAAPVANKICVIFGPGVYKFTANWAYTIAASSSITLIGTGQDVTNLTFPNASGGWTLTYSAITSSAHIRDMTFLAGGAFGATDGLTLTTSAAVSNPANSAISDVTNVTFRGSDGYSVTNHWTDGITVNSISNVNFYGINITGSSSAAGNGIQIKGSSTAIPVQFNISNSSFENNNIGLVYGTYTQGVTVSQCNFTGGAFGIVSPAGIVSPDQLGVFNSQFNNSTNAIQLNVNVPGSQIVGNMFIVTPTNTGAIQITNPGLYQIVGNQFQAASVTGTYGIQFATAGSAAGIISGNSFYRLGTGIILGASSTGVNVQSNAYTANTTNVSNSGTGNTVGGGSQ